MEPSDVVYALENCRRNSFIPSIENYFGGFQAKYGMIDARCNTHLLAIEEGGLPALLQRFPTPTSLTPANELSNCFFYKVELGGEGTEAPVLFISRSNNPENDFLVRLCGDLYPHEFVLNEPLRFSICYDDAVALIAGESAGAISIIGSPKLSMYVHKVDLLRTQYQGWTSLGRRKTCSLLGRSLIGLGGRQMRYIDKLTIISADQNRICANLSTSEFYALYNECHGAVIEKIGYPRFDSLGNDYTVEGAYEDDVFYDPWGDEGNDDR